MKLFEDLFQFLDILLLNDFLRHTELYTAGNAFKIKMTISQFESLAAKVDKRIQSSASKQLNHLREAANLLVVEKSMLTDADTVAQVCTHLNLKQVKHIIDNFKPDDISPDAVPKEVLEAISAHVQKLPNLDLEIDADHQVFNNNSALFSLFLK